MPLSIPALSLAAALAAAPLPPDSLPAPADSAAARARVVRSFPAIEVRALVHDLRSSQTVHLLPGATLRSLPVDDLAALLRLQPGVVAQAEELHVRGGRAGETAVVLEGLDLGEPQWRRAMIVPTFALRSAELVSGAPDARYGGALAGVLDLRTVDPGEHLSGEWRWTTDGRTGTHYDRIGGRIGGPLRVAGLGVVAAGEAMLDDTDLPNLRTARRDEVLGIPFGWRAENQLSGFVKLAPVARPDAFSAQVLVSRRVSMPYSPNWSLDGWVVVPASTKDSPSFTLDEQPGSQRWRAADHMGITDDERLAVLLRAGTTRARRRAGVSLGWVRARAVTSPGGGHEGPEVAHRARYGRVADTDPFYVLWGDLPLYRESASDVVTLRGDGALTTARGVDLSGGVGLTVEHVELREMDWQPFAIKGGAEGIPYPVDSIRTYDATAPGGFAYVQGRWQSGGLVLNTGLRAEYFTAGPQGSRQTLPGASGVLSFGPRLGLAYPISVRDVFSLAYVRMQQAPARDLLYDTRTAISDRQPLGNPALEPATLISYEAAVKHLFSPEWALQTSLFYRDVFGQPGAQDYRIPGGAMNLRYVDEDQSHVMGWELSAVHVAPRLRLEAHYTWMSAWGNESRPGGDPYGPVRAADTPAISDQPLSWDRTHTFVLDGVWRGPHALHLAWSSMLGSPLPWTPKPRRQPLTDLNAINSRRLGWVEQTDVSLRWAPPRSGGLAVGLEVRNLFDHRHETAATLDGYPNPVINTVYDDYGAYRTETGLGGGAWWRQPIGGVGEWVPVHDRRLLSAPRTVRLSVGTHW